jgi:hypothetical protein
LDQGASGANNIYISSSGFVGLNTTTPNSNLHVNGNNPFVRINNIGNGDAGLKISYNGLDTAGLHLIYNPSLATASIDNTYPSTANQVYGDIHIRQNVGGAMTTRIYVKADGGNVAINKATANSTLDINGNTIITGSLTVITGSSVEFQVTNTGVKIGNIISDTHTVTGSLNVSGSITGSLLGTASFAVSASWAPGGGGAAFPYVGRAVITGSLIVSASSTASAFIGSGSNVLTVDGVSGRLFSVSDSFTGSLFSVNTVAGLPIIEAFSDNTVRMGQYGTNVFYISQSRAGFGKETALNATIDVSGSLIVSGSLTVITGSSVQLQVLNAGVKIGNIVTDIHTVTGSLRVSGSITGSLFGTASSAVSAAWAPAGAASATTTVTFNRVTGSYTFVLTDAGKAIEVSGSTNVSHSLTIPASSSVDFADGTYIDVILYGTGSILFVTGSGVTLRSANNWIRMGTRYGASTLINISGNEWYLIGNINA